MKQYNNFIIEFITPDLVFDDMTNAQILEFMDFYYKGLDHRKIIRYAEKLRKEIL